MNSCLPAGREPLQDIVYVPSENKYTTPIEPKKSSSPHGGGGFRWGGKGPGRPPPSFPSPIIRGKEMI